MLFINISKFDCVVVDVCCVVEQCGYGYCDCVLKMYLWICGCCVCEFDCSNVQQFIVYYCNYNYDDNFVDGSNWELLCVYCYDNEYQCYFDYDSGIFDVGDVQVFVIGNFFVDFKVMLECKKQLCLCCRDRWG